MTKNQLIEELNKKNDTTYFVSDCHSEIKIWDKDACESINLVAKGLVNLTELFKSQKIEITGFKLDVNGLDMANCSTKTL